MPHLTAKEAALLIHTCQLAATLREQKDPTSGELKRLLREQAKNETDKIATHEAMKCEKSAPAQIVILSAHMSLPFYMQGFHTGCDIPASLLLEFTRSIMGDALDKETESYATNALSLSAESAPNHSIDHLQTSITKLPSYLTHLIKMEQISLQATKCKLMHIIYTNYDMVRELYRMARGHKKKYTTEDMAKYIIEVCDLEKTTTIGEIRIQHTEQFYIPYYSDFHAGPTPTQEEETALIATKQSDGTDIARNDYVLGSQITAEKLNHVIEEGPNKGKSNAEYLAERPAPETNEVSANAAAEDDEGSRSPSRNHPETPHDTLVVMSKVIPKGSVFSPPRENTGEASEMSEAQNNDVESASIHNLGFWSSSDLESSKKIQNID
ncbi:MAG: hypothetical protein VX737_04030 [Pseudomonadota bacterium]|nr:hypothetical protein [Pseudomonadota bacterium]